MERVLKKFNSFAASELHEIEYWRSMDGNAKLILLEDIRKRFMELNGEDYKGFARVLSITTKK